MSGGPEVLFQAQTEGLSMVKMSLDPVQVMSGQAKELKVSPSSNGDSRGSWEEKEEFDQDNLGLTTKPKPVSVSSPCFYELVIQVFRRLTFASWTYSSKCWV